MKGSLYQFFGGYYHQDWEMDHGRSDEVLQRFVTDSSEGMRHELVAELDALLDSCETDDALSAIVFHDLGCFYDPSQEGITMRTWLRSLRTSMVGT